MRAGPAALAVAGVLLLGGLVSLRCSLRDVEAPPPVAAAAPPARTAAPAPVAARTAEPLPPAPAPRWVPPPHRNPHVAHVVAAETPALPAPAPILVPQRDPKPPIANKPTLRAQTAAVEPEVRACADEAAREGYVANGTALLTWIVGGHDGKAEIETTGIEDARTTIDDQPLLDCLQKTANAMHYNFAPDTYAVYAMRLVKFENGKLTENKFIDFHYLR